jgi:NAD(P)-dependent dehydrogenase (short-subunit alcohol dehydrogenase family)
MVGICDGRVAIVTGAGRGLGREYALELARQGARVVVNDLGTGLDGHGRSTGPAHEVVDVIRSFGGDAIANGEDVSSWEAAERLIQDAVDAFGRLDVLVNNAGIVRDRMLVNMTADEWDAVIRVHLRGTFAPSRWAASYWRDRTKSGDDTDGRIINTTSTSGMYGNVGQINYGTAKAGIASFTIIAAMELARYGVTVNAVAPSALTRMTEQLRKYSGSEPSRSGPFDPRSPENVASVVAWLASAESRQVTGRVFNVAGGRITIGEGWHAGPTFDKGERWDAGEVGHVITELASQAAPNADMKGDIAHSTR